LLWQKNFSWLESIAIDRESGQPWAVGLDARNRNLKTTVFNADGSVIRQTGGNGVEIEYDVRDKVFWVLGRHSATSYFLQKVDRDGKVLLEKDIDAVPDLPLVLNLSVNQKDGSVWLLAVPHPSMLAIGDSYVLGYSSDGNLKQKISLGESHARALAIDSTRNVLWVTLAEQGLRKYSTGGQLLLEAPVDGAVCVEPDTGCVWVGADDGLYRLDPSGQIIWSKASTSLSPKRVCIVAGG
jgi:ligand-binding sensor domain-containing protein